MKKILIYGAGGAGRELCDNIKNDKLIDVIGIIDDTMEPGTMIDGTIVVGGASYLKEYDGDIAFCIVGVPLLKKTMIELIKKDYPGVQFPVLINARSCVSTHASFGEGAIVAQPYNHIVPGVQIGKHVWINSYCGIGHNVKIGDWTTIYTNVHFGGGSQVGERCVIGTSVTIKPGVKIGNNVIAGGGTVIVRDVPDNVTIVGNPARIIKEHGNG
jgi:sugar O-acyltransferase (sialic acid O-acetyltransferase NeuD family)